MKLRDKILYMSFGTMLVVLGMVLNSLVSGDADAQEGLKDTEFNTVFCRSLIIHDGTPVVEESIFGTKTEYKMRELFGLSDSGNVVLRIFGDDGETEVTYLGLNEHPKSSGGMVFQLLSTSKTDKSMVGMQINEDGGRFDSWNNMGKNVVRLTVADDGGGNLDLRDKFGYRK